MMGEEMEKLRDEIRANALKPSTSNRGRNQGDRRQSMKFTRVTKIEFLKFRGEDVKGWMYKREQLQFMRLLGSDIVPWLVYSGSISFDDPLAEAISFYMAGLPTDVELVVRMFRPQTLANTYSLSKLHHKPLTLPTPNANWRTKPSTSQSTPFRRRLTQKELEENRAKNQCFYCDQKYTPGHKCTGQVYLLEVVAEPVIIMEYLVNISKRRAFWSLNKDILKINDSEYQYAISIMEDTAYPCLHSLKTTKETSSIRSIQRRPIRRIKDIVCKDSGRYQAWSLLQEMPNTSYPTHWIRRIEPTSRQYK
ncbi:hypothetical protein Tco_0926214 [Tanacetum coccineum]|uniref:Uncharacterized protein n=1 Tax=Tanacetum coccineum TaxID=301880 RepID=A0ABQ5D968_9ASTR